ncbi:DUF1120 domain-containing protein [Leclercia sp.]|uniref:DUF1120 domain-containing protein n=1 Tax=Leclercia sp. TaxID=1898428 RepID=UPI002FDCD014
MSAFKKTVSAVAVCAAFLASSQAMAANDLTLKVTGSIAPAACTPALSGNGEVAFGSMATSAITNAPTGNSLVQLGTKNVTLTISCDAAATVGFTMTDNRASSAVALSETAYLEKAGMDGTNADGPLYGFGLGLASNGEKIGAYSLVVDSVNTTADGAEVAVITSDNKGKGWVEKGLQTQLTNGERIMTVANKGSVTPKLFEELSMPLKISAGVQTKSVLGGDAITFDGNATLSMVYL